MGLLFENDKIMLFSKGHSQILLIQRDQRFCQNDEKEWIEFQCDNDDRMERVIRKIYGQGLKIRLNLEVFGAGDKGHGNLRHWILADAYGMQVSDLQNGQVFLINPKERNNLCLSNLYCPLIRSTETPNVKIYRSMEEICILVKATNTVVRLDYSDNMMDFLTSGILRTFSFGGNEQNRLKCVIAETKKTFYMAHIVMAQHYFGKLPINA